MSRAALAVLIATLLVGGTGTAFAQVGCQPTIMQPCAKPADKPNSPAAKRTDAARSDNSDEPKDGSPRVKLNNDTDFKFGSGGFGLGRKF